MAYKEQKLISHGSRGWKAQDQSTKKLSVRWGPGSWFIDSSFFSVFSWLRGEGLIWNIFWKSMSPGVPGWLSGLSLCLRLRS